MTKTDKNQAPVNEDFEAKHNLLGFFNLLFEIDKRNNPHLYKKLNDDSISCCSSKVNREERDFGRTLGNSSLFDEKNNL